MADQYFIAEIKIFTDCKETVDEAFIANWILEQFDGADVGSVDIKEVNEVK